MSVVDEAVTLSKRLDKAVAANENSDVFAILEALGRVPMTVAALQVSRVGIAAGKLKSHSESRIADAAKDLIATWKKLAEKQGVTARPRPPIMGGSTAAFVGKQEDGKLYVEPEEDAPSMPDSEGTATPMLASQRSDSAPSHTEPGVLSPVAAAPATVKPEPVPESPTAKVHMRLDAAAVGAALPGVRTRTWKVLADTFLRICKKIVADATSPTGSGLGRDWPTDEKQLQVMTNTAALDLEALLWRHLGGENPAKPLSMYSDQFRSLALGLSQNVALVANIMTGVQPLEGLVTATSDELASEESKKSAQAMRKAHVESVMMDWQEKNKKMLLASAGISAVEGLFKCPKCGSSNTDYYEKQTRSADEPTTKFCNCVDCGYRWKFC